MSKECKYCFYPAGCQNGCIEVPATVATAMSAISPELILDLYFARPVNAGSLPVGVWFLNAMKIRDAEFFVTKFPEFRELIIRKEYNKNTHILDKLREYNRVLSERDQRG
jgi:hypothetical protein